MKLLTTLNKFQHFQKYRFTNRFSQKISRDDNLGQPKLVLGISLFGFHMKLEGIHVSQTDFENISWIASKII